MIDRWRRWRRLPRAERALALRAVALLALARPALRLAGVRFVLRRLRPAAGSGATPALVPARTVALVDAVARPLFWRPTCLERAVAAAWLLRGVAWRGTLMIGARTDANGFAAHAWLCADDAALGDPLPGPYAPVLAWPVGRRA